MQSRLEVGRVKRVGFKWMMMILFAIGQHQPAWANEDAAKSSGRWVAWAEKPSAIWEDAFVTGNGRHGTMVMGQPGDERIICVHEELFIRGWDREKVAVADIAGMLPELRKLIDEGNTDKAAQLADTEARRQLTEMGAPHVWPLSPHPAFDLRIISSTTSTVC